MGLSPAISMLSSALTTVASFILLYITWRYTRATLEMVKEMRAARAAQILPKVIVNMSYVGLGQAFIRLVNVGPGSALNVALTMRLEPDGGSFPFSYSVLTPGETITFWGMDPKGGPNQIMVEQIAAKHSHVSIEGSCVDAMGNSHSIGQRHDIRQEWERIKATEPELHRTEAANAVRELRRLEGIERALQEIRDRLSER